MFPWLYILLCLLVVAVCVRPLGTYMAEIYSGGRTWLSPALGWLETGIYRIAGIHPDDEMTWSQYAAAVLLFGAGGFALLFSIFVMQHALPLNPQEFPGLAPDLAFNAAMSFVTNTNWQNYGGETSLSYLSQMAGCTVQNFLSAATGMAVAVALFRGLARKQTTLIGNFWADMVRGTVYILLPLSLVFAIFLVSQGVVQNLSAYTPYMTLEKNVEGLIAQGPAASQVAIKMLGSNGGGFFNANGAHPFENPTPFSNFLQILSILLIPASLVYCFGVMVGDRRQGWVLLAAMTAIFLPLALLAMEGEGLANPKLPAIVDQSAGNMEGKEVRVGAVPSALWAVTTTATSNGSVNSMHDSYMPLSGMIPMLLIQFGEVIFGGVGSGAFGMIIYVLLTVFIGGLMVGRTPEYLGKKLGPYDIKMASLVIILPAAFVLSGAALAVATEAGRAGIFNPGAQGLSEVLYAFASTSNNNGSAFAGLSGNSPFYNLVFGLWMFAGRYLIIVPVLAVAGSLASKNASPFSPGTLPTHTPLFTIMLIGVILLLDVLTYVPSLALGPIAEHLHLFHTGGAAAP